MKQFDITYFYGPDEADFERPGVIRRIAEAGFTLIPLGFWHSAESNRRVLPLLEKEGLRAHVWDGRIEKIYRNNDLDGADAAVAEVVKDYAPFPNVVGFDVTDEPSFRNFEVLGKLVAAFRKYAPDKETVINLLPNYATAEQFGTPDCRSYLESFIEKVNPHFLSYDHYHFLGRENRNASLDPNIDERERLIRIAAEKTENRGGFFDNIELVRGIAQKYRLDPMLIVLLTEHGSYRNLTRAEILWEINMCLVYGMRRLSYFTYWEPEADPFWQWTNAMCDRTGKPTPHYFDVQAINQTVLPVGKILFGKKSEAVFHVGKPEESAKAFSPYGGIDSIEGNNGVIGFFSDGLVYLVNRDFVSENTFTLSTPKKLERFGENGSFSECRNSFRLGAGQAVLLRIRGE